MAVLDGLQSVRYAMIFVQWGPEMAVEKFFNWLVQRARSRPAKMEQFNLYFTAISFETGLYIRRGFQHHYV